MIQAISHWPLTTDARVQSEESFCGVYGGQSDSGTIFFPSVLRLFSVNIIPRLLHILSASSNRQWQALLIAEVITAEHALYETRNFSTFFTKVRH